MVIEGGAGLGDSLLEIGGIEAFHPNEALYGNGNITYAGSLNPSSDESLKENIVDADSRTTLNMVVDANVVYRR